MNKKVLLLATIMIFIFSIPSFASETNKTITVSGEHSIYVKPDICKIVFEIISKDINQNKALKDNSLRTNNLIEAFKKNNIKAENINTLDFNVSPQYTYDDGKETFQYYNVSNTIELTLSDLSKVGEFISLASKSGADKIGYLNYESSKADEYYNEALMGAVKNAKSKADSIAKALNIKVSYPNKITESSNNYYPIYRNNLELKESMDSISTPIEVKDLNIKASISVEFSF